MSETCRHGRDFRSACKECDAYVWEANRQRIEAREAARQKDRNEGAAAIVGLINMGIAIRNRRRKCPTCRCMVSIVADGCMCCGEPDWYLDDDERQL